MDNDKIISIKNRAQALAYSILKNQEDAEDISQLAVVEYVRAIDSKPGITSNLRWIVINCIRREFGDTRYGRGKFNYAQRNSFARIVSDAPEDSRGLVREDAIATDKVEFELSESRFDSELLERCTSFLDGASWRELATFRGVTEGRISQIKSKQREKLVKQYLWRHYQEYGIESEIDIDWICI